MIYRCKCGNFKSGQPFRSSAEKVWVCDKCAGDRKFRRDPVPDDVASKVSAPRQSNSLLTRIKHTASS